jgi:hypothetical protein
VPFLLSGEVTVMNLDQRTQQDRDRERQPLHCRGCPWGKWTGTKQTCLRLECVRREMDPTSDQKVVPRN